MKQTKHTCPVLFYLIPCLLMGCGDSSKKATQDPPTNSQIPVERVVLDRSSTIAGTDSDRNGVRDDVDQIIKNFNATPDQQVALLAVAKTFQDMMLKGQAPEKSNDVFNDMEKSLRCLSIKSQDYKNQAFALYAATINTEERVRAEASFRKNLKPRVDEFDAPSCS